VITLEHSQEVVMPGLVPGIHVLCAAWQGVDGRDKRVETPAPPTRTLSFGTKTSVNRGELPLNPLKRMAFRATLRDPDGFGHIGWMIRLSGSSVPRRAFRPPGFFQRMFSWGSGE
jgi:hypothetical protein